MLDVVVTAPLNRSRVGSRLAARPSRFHGAVTTEARASEKVTGRPFGTEREGRVPSLPPSVGASERARPFVTRLGRGRTEEGVSLRRRAGALAPDPLAGLTTCEGRLDNVRDR